MDIIIWLIGVIVGVIVAFAVEKLLITIIEDPRRRYIAVAVIFVLVVVAFVYAASPRFRDVVEAGFSDPTDRTCFCSAKILTPTGADLETDAPNYPVAPNTKVTWEPNDCVMVVQAYKKHVLVNELKGQGSGKVTVQQATGGRIGVIEVKIFRDGFQTESSKVWIEVTP